MDNIQVRVDSMRNGSVTAIMNGIHSDCPFELLNAIIAGTKIHLLDIEFIECVKAATKIEIVMMGVPLSDFAIAALETLGIQKYSGNNQRIKELIQCKFEIL